MNKSSSINSFKPSQTATHIPFFPPFFPSLFKRPNPQVNPYTFQNNFTFGCACMYEVGIGRGHGKRQGMLKVFVVVSKLKHACVLIKMTY